MIVVLVLALLFALLFLAVPVSFAILIAGIVGLYEVGGYYAVAGILKSGPYDHVVSYTLTTLPMFVLMAELMTAARVTSDLFRAANSWLGHLRGGLAYAAVSGGVLLAAVCGSSSAAAATLSSSIHPEMRRYGYSDGFSTGAIAAVGTLAIMIPPSIALVLYAILTETSVGKLLLAGVIPGLLTAVTYAVVIGIILRRSSTAVTGAAQEYVPLARRFRTSMPAMPMFVLLVAMLVLIYTGIVTPTEVGALGALSALVIAVVMGRTSREAMVTALFRATRSSAMIFSIIAFSSVFSVFLTLSGAPQKALILVQSSGLGPTPVLVMVIMIILALGVFLDQIAILIITMPLVFPLMTGLGYDPIWLGIIVVKTAEIGLLTPPVGMNLFIVSAASKVPVATVARGVIPFCVAELLVLFLLVVFPGISLWLPGTSSSYGGE